MEHEAVQAAVLEGQHPYDAVAFHSLFRAMKGIDAYVQSLETWGWDWGGNAAQYDVVLLYNFHKEAPEASEHPIRMALERLKSWHKGVVVLHHALWAFPQEPIWSRLAGTETAPDDQFHPDQCLKVVAMQTAHPIVSGQQDFIIHDESYVMREPNEDCQVLLATAHEKSMKALAWTHMVDEKRVFCMQLGHDRRAWECAPFREILRRGILWSAECL